MGKGKVFRKRAPNDDVRMKANRAVARFLASNPAPIGGEFWRENEVFVHGFYMFMAGYRAAQRDLHKKGLSAAKKVAGGAGKKGRR